MTYTDDEKTVKRHIVAITIAEKAGQNIYDEKETAKFLMLLATQNKKIYPPDSQQIKKLLHYCKDIDTEMSVKLWIGDLTYQTYLKHAIHFRQTPKYWYYTGNVL